MMYKIKDIKKYLRLILTENGLTAKDANLTASILLEGDLRGYPAHGIGRILQILDGIEKRTLDLQAIPRTIKKRKSVEIWDGHYGLGQIIGHKAMLRAIKLAKKNGIGLVGVINAGHLGILSYYSELAAKESCIGVVLTTSSPAVVLPGGKTKTFGTNPISFSIPHSPFIITGDFATSKVSRGRLIDALHNNESIPESWAVDKMGNPTQDPQQALLGGLQVFDAGHKGACLSFLVSMLAGPLIGGVTNNLVTGTRDMSDVPNKGDFFLVLDIENMTSMQLFDEKLKYFASFIEEQSSNFRIPGKLEYERVAYNDAHGIDISEKLEHLFKKYKK